MNLPFFSKHQGNMAEYILPVVLVGLVAVGGLAWLGQGNQAESVVLRSTQGERLTQNQSGQTALVSKKYGQNPNLQALSLTLVNGKTIQLQNVPANVALSVEVVGPNGTTTELLAVLEELIAQLEANGENPDTLNALKKLATTGYALAHKQRIIENKAAKCGQDKVCMDAGGKTNDTARQAAYSMVLNTCASELHPVCDKESYFQIYGLTSLTPSDWRVIKTLQPGFEEKVLSSGQYNYSKENVLVGPDLAKFIRAYRDAEKNPSASNSVNSIVSIMAQQIFGISRLASNGFATVGIGSNFEDRKLGQTNPLGSNLESTPDEYFQVVAEKIQTQGVPSLFSSKTSERSNVICTTGQGRREDGQCR